MVDEQSEQEAMDGSPALVETPDGFIRIKFQCGVIPEVEKNGATIREVIQLLVDRLSGFQQGEFKCLENEQAIMGLSTAWHSLDARERDRKERGVEGKHEA